MLMSRLASALNVRAPCHGRGASRKAQSPIASRFHILDLMPARAPLRIGLSLALGAAGLACGPSLPPGTVEIGPPAAGPADSEEPEPGRSAAHAAGCSW